MAHPAVHMDQSQQVSFKEGVLSTQGMKALIETGGIQSTTAITEKQLQPASLDLRLGSAAYRVQAGFLPSNATVEEYISGLKMHEIDLSNGGVLEKGAVYIVPLQESLNLDGNMSGVASPKSSTGRLDIFTRLLTDFGSLGFDKVKSGYKGGLYLEVSPMTFSIIAHTGDCLNQLRLRVGNTTFSDTDLRLLDETEPLVYLADSNNEKANISNGLWMSVDLEGKDDSGIIAYRAKHHAPLIDLKNIGHYAVSDFWEPIYKNPSNRLILNPEDFYIMASREHLRVPAEYSAEMMPYETTAGELRVHYAGFFDPGFGCTDDGSQQGTTGVLEIRSHDVPFVLEHGQRICRMVYERLTEVPDKIYSRGIGSNYAAQGLKLAKQFKQD